MVEFIIKYIPAQKNIFEIKIVGFHYKTHEKRLENLPKNGIGNCLKEYLDTCKPFLNKDEGIKALCQSYYFRLIFHSAQDVYAGKWQALQETLKASYWNSQSPSPKDGYLTIGQLPIIHLTTYDIFNHRIDKLSTKPYKKIIDSSIWNYYVPLDVTEKDKDGNVIKDKKGEPIWKYDNNYGLFVNALKDIVRNTDNHLYELAITHEFADLNARLLEQSYLDGCHRSLSPFLFHSEQEMKKEIENYGDAKDIFNYYWHFLLLDDKGVDKMLKVDNSPVEMSKLQIITRDLQYLGFKEDKIWFRTIDFEPVRGDGDDRKILDGNGKIFRKKNGKNVEPIIRYGKVTKGHFEINEENHKYKYTPFIEAPASSNDVQIVIDCVKHVDEAQYCLQKYKYEIVLLDYLLDKDKIKKNQEYGYDLLEKLQNWNKKGRIDNPNLYKPGPHNRFFFMFISAFTTAVQERLLERGFNRSELRLWFIGDGACPTNTPCLFSHLLLQLMRRRIMDLQRGFEGKFLTIIRLLEEIYVRDSAFSIENVREEAYNHFNDLLFMRAKYKSLENDLDINDEKNLKKTPNDTNYIMNMKSSLLVYSAFKVVHHFSDIFFDHLQHLVYLTAFGTIRQWQDMWEEYLFVYKTIVDYDNYEMEEKEKDRGKKICTSIKKYIINLKENSIG